MKVRTLKLRLEHFPDDADITIMHPEADALVIGDILFFEKEKEVWLCVDDGNVEDEPELLEGDMCTLPECKGDDAGVPDPVDICEVGSRGAQVA